MIIISFANSAALIDFNGTMIQLASRTATIDIIKLKQNIRKIIEIKIRSRSAYKDDSGALIPKFMPLCNVLNAIFCVSP